MKRARREGKREGEKKGTREGKKNGTREVQIRAPRGS